MKIGLFGYGKMGMAIEKIAIAKGHEVVWRVNRGNRTDFSPEKLREADVAIEFSRPESGFANVRDCLLAGLPVVSGTTGWLGQMSEARQLCLEQKGSFFWASNFSVGVNLFFLLNQKLASLMANQPGFHPKMTEFHHIHKLDAPSGTAVTLANDLIFYSNKVENWVLSDKNNAESPDPNSLEIEAIREGEIPGTHIVKWESPVDFIEIKHVAFSREGFASGAVLAAEWLIGREGSFGMPDLLNA